MSTKGNTPSTTSAKLSILRSTCRESFEDFCKHFWDTLPGIPTLIWNWHLSLFCTELQYVAERVFAGKEKEHDLLCNVSPGSSKTSVFSILFPAWCWTRMPSARFIVASNTERLVLDIAYKAKSVLESDLYRSCYPEVVIQADRSAKGDFVNTAGGERLSCTVGGQSPIGRHCHFAIVDDPIDPTKALSEVELEAAKVFMEQVIPSRKVRTNVDLAVTCLVMQRLHQDDPSGLWLKKHRSGAMRIRHVCLPAEIITSEKAVEQIQPPELQQNYIDGLMDPVRLSMKVLDGYRLTNRYSYAGQFLQSPTPLEGGMFRFDYFRDRRKAAPYDAVRVRGWDRASSASGKGCRTVGTLMARDKDNYFWVEDVVVCELEPYERNEMILHVARKDRARYGPKHEPTIYIEMEGGSSGRDAWKAIARHLAGYPVREERVTGNKVARAESWSSALAAGIVRVVDNGESENNGRSSWDIDDFVNEHCHFPFGTYLDQVDSATLCFNVLKGKKVSSGPALMSISIGKRRDNLVRLLVCHRDELSSVESEVPALLIHVLGPKDEQHSLTHTMTNVMGTCVTRFADLQPVECQDRWEEPDETTGFLPCDIVFSEHHGKALWNFLMRKYPANPGLLIFVYDEEGDRRAVSLACAVCECLRMDIKNVRRLSTEDDIDAPPNRHAYDLMKHCRSLVG